MALNTLHNVTLTEGQIGIILCSLEDSVKKSEHFREDMVKGQSLQPFDDYVNDVDTIFNILEGSVDKYYDKIMNISLTAKENSKELAISKFLLSKFEITKNNLKEELKLLDDAHKSIFNSNLQYNNFLVSQSPTSWNPSYFNTFRTS